MLRERERERERGVRGGQHPEDGAEDKSGVLVKLPTLEGATNLATPMTMPYPVLGQGHLVHSCLARKPVFPPHPARHTVVLVSAVACALAKPGLVGSPLGYNGLAYGALGGYGAYGHGLGLGLGGIAPYGAGPLAYSGLASPIAYSGLASPVAYSGLSAPVAYAAAAPAVAVGVRTQYHAQDELGQASYGHAEPFQTHNAVQDAHGNKIGSYSYVAPDGQVIKTDYVADGAGYRVASNALPVGPSVLPAPVHDTPEVVAARAAHLAEVAAVHSRSKRGIALGHLPASTGPLAVAAPLAVVPAISSYSSVVAGPVVSPYSSINAYGVPALSHYSAYAAPAVRAATLTTVVNNPGHAVSYRVD
uniref:Cuticle protein 7 n=1 Tax=Timema douglasi TaxID=61478 RepID=A0A7R8ZAL6_TIMDO|nr:unnamed protein product [Timema douglasi]